MHMGKTQFISILILATAASPCFGANLGKASGEGAMSGNIEQTAAADRFKPTHSYAWKESHGAKQQTVIYLFDRDVPTDQWADAENRSAAISAWTIANKATVVSWILDDVGKPGGVQSCDANGSCYSSGNSVMNGVSSLVVDIKSDANGKLSGTLSQGSPGCGDQWCDVTSRYSIDTALAAPTLQDRIASNGKTDSGDSTAAEAALTAYWKAAGTAKKSDDLTPYFSDERKKESARQKARNGKMVESMFTRMFVPGHSGKLEINEIRFLDDSALATIKSRVGSGNAAHELKCGVLLSKQAGGWKIGAEHC